MRSTSGSLLQSCNVFREDFELLWLRLVWRVFFVKKRTFWNPFRTKFDQLEGVPDPHQFQTMESSRDDSALTIAVISKSISLKDSTKSELFKTN